MKWLLCLLLISGCGHFQRNSERMFYNMGVNTLKWTVENNSTLMQICGYDFNVKSPVVMADDRESMDGNWGLYYKEVEFNRGGSVEIDSLIRYWRWRPSVLGHEAVHHLNRHKKGGGNVSWRCLDELASDQNYKIMMLINERDYLRRELDNTRRHVR